MSSKLLPLALVDYTPGELFTRLPVPETEAIHTGGYLSLDGMEVWKPLDAKPYANADYRVETREADVLHLMAGQPGFPRNWRVEESNQRRWLVRPVCKVVGQTFSRDDVDLAFALPVDKLCDRSMPISGKSTTTICLLLSIQPVVNLSSSTSRMPVRLTPAPAFSRMTAT